MWQGIETGPYLMIAGIKAPFLAICLLRVPIPLLQRKTLESGATRHFDTSATRRMGYKDFSLQVRVQVLT